MKTVFLPHNALPLVAAINNGGHPAVTLQDHPWQYKELSMVDPWVTTIISEIKHIPLLHELLDRINVTSHVYYFQPIKG
jgi:hypothetical protein